MISSSILKQNTLQQKKDVQDFFKNEKKEKDGMSQIKIVGAQAKIMETPRKSVQRAVDIPVGNEGIAGR